MDTLEESQVEHVMRKLAFEDTLQAEFMIRPRGSAPVWIDSLEALYIVFEPNSKSYPAVDFDEMISWVREKIQDVALADKLADFDPALSYFERCQHTYLLLHSRLLYFAEVLGVDVNPTEVQMVTPDI